jgi:hypothetical protein
MGQLLPHQQQPWQLRGSFKQIWHHGPETAKRIGVAKARSLRSAREKRSCAGVWVKQQFELHMAACTDAEPWPFLRVGDSAEVHSDGDAMLAPCRIAVVLVTCYHCKKHTEVVQPACIERGSGTARLPIRALRKSRYRLPSRAAINANCGLVSVHCLINQHRPW